MSAAAPAVAQEPYDALARRDGAAIFTRLHPDVECRRTGLLPRAGRCSGHEGARRFSARLRGAIDPAVTVERLIDAGEHVVAVGRTRGRTLASDAAFDVAIAHVWAVGDDGVARLDACVDTPAVGEALGAR